jgi:hypothetical protein
VSEVVSTPQISQPSGMHAVPVQVAHHTPQVGSRVMYQLASRPPQQEQDYVIEPAAISGLNETQHIIAIISDSNARILNIFENSIEGEISIEEFQIFKDSLDDRRIAYFMTRPNDIRLNRWTEGLETVSFSDSWGFYDDVELDTPPIIRFRIYKRN